MLKSAAEPRAEAEVARPVIMIECLKCGHTGRLDDVMLKRHGEQPGAPIAAFAQRLTCSRCGSHSFKAARTGATT
jgi:ribosomal protein S27AE